jgi:UDP-N-acetylglucosamine 4-epimerase
LNQLFTSQRDGTAAHRPSAAGLDAEHQDERPGDVRHSQADVSAITEALAYQPTHDVATGLRETVDWFVVR